MGSSIHLYWPNCVLYKSQCFWIVDKLQLSKNALPASIQKVQRGFLHGSVSMSKQENAKLLRHEGFHCWNRFTMN